MVIIVTNSAEIHSRKGFFVDSHAVRVYYIVVTFLVGERLYLNATKVWQAAGAARFPNKKGLSKVDDRFTGRFSYLAITFPVQNEASPYGRGMVYGDWEKAEYRRQARTAEP